MVEHAPEQVSTRESGRVLGRDRTESLFRIVIVILVAGVLGLGGLFGYTVWQTRQAENTATPAQRAIRDLEALVRKEPNSAAARVRLAEALAAAGSTKKATAQLEIAIKLDPKHTGAWLDLGLIAMQDKQTDEAQGYFQKVVELTEGAQYEAINSRREQAFFHLGEIALDARRFDDASASFKAAIRIRKDASDSYYLLAQSLKGMGEDDAAMKQLDAALTFDPNYPEAQYMYGELLLAKGDEINAAVHLRKAADLAPEQREPIAALAKLGSAKDAVAEGRSALEDGNVSKAIDSALLARALDPKYVDAVVLQAEALVRKGDKKAAIAVFKEAKALDPKNVTVIKALSSLGVK